MDLSERVSKHKDQLQRNCFYFALTEVSFHLAAASAQLQVKEESVRYWEPRSYSPWDSVPSSALQLHCLHHLLWHLPSSHSSSLSLGHMDSTSDTFTLLLHIVDHPDKLTARNRVPVCMHKTLPPHPLLILYG